MKTCALCRQDYYPYELSPESKYVYCYFCYYRLGKIRSLFDRHGKCFHLRQLHRPAYYWRQTPELDRDYPPFEAEELESAA